MKVKIFVLVFLFISVSLLSNISFAYRQDYPPYRFKDSPPVHLNVKPLVSGYNVDYKSKDGSVVVHLKEPKLYEVEFFLKVGKTMLVSLDQKKEDFPCAVFQADLDNNGLDDFIVFYNSRGPGLGGHQDRVEVYFRKSKGDFEKITYNTLDTGIEDFIGPDKEGKYKVIITGFYEGDRHNYFSYNVYEFKNYRLVNADAKIKGFPKFVQYTYNKNDQDTERLTQQERLLHMKEKNSTIKYEDMCSDSVVYNAPELKPKETDFTHKNYLAGLKLLKDSVRQYEKDKKVSWDIEEIGIPNALVRIEGYVLKLREENARLELENAKLRKDKNALGQAANNLKQVEYEIKKFLAERTYVD